VKTDERRKLVNEVRRRLTRDGPVWTRGPERIGRDPDAEPMPRCRAFRLPDAVLEPPFMDFRPF